jgi:hypothetical protein
VLDVCAHPTSVKDGQGILPSRVRDEEARRPGRLQVLVPLLDASNIVRQRLSKR